MYLNLEDYHQAARTYLMSMVYSYYFSGADDEVTLTENRRAFERIKLLSWVLIGVSERNLFATVLGHRVPVLIAPAAFQRLARLIGELAMDRAAQAGTILILSTLATTSVETVAASVRIPLWFRFDFHKNPTINLELVRRAEASGSNALVVMVDAAAWGDREAAPASLSLKLENLIREMPLGEGSSLNRYVHQLFKMDPSWQDVASGSPLARSCPSVRSKSKIWNEKSCANRSYKEEQA